MKEFAFFDVDYTLYEGYLCTNFNLYLANKKHVPNPNLVYETESRIQEVVKTDYQKASKMSIQHTADILKGKTVEEVKNIQEMFMVQEQNRIFPWVKSLLGILKAKDYEIYLISAAAVPPLRAVAEYLGIDNVFGSNLSVKDNIYTGGIENILNYEEKTKLIHRKIARTHDGSKRLGFGDSMGDVYMLSNVDIAFVYEPKSDQIKQLAAEKGWSITDRNNITGIVCGFL